MLHLAAGLKKTKKFSVLALQGQKYELGCLKITRPERAWVAKPGIVSSLKAGSPLLGITVAGRPAKVPAISAPAGFPRRELR